MRKIFSLFAALTLSAGLWALDNVRYIDANGVEQTANNVTEVASSSDQVTWNAGWYVVTGNNVTLSKGAVCNGAVHLILADGAKLTAKGVNSSYTPGIQVSGDGKSLAFYGQAAQSGQLVATGGSNGAGIGGGYKGSGQNITINGGVVTATGGNNAAGIGGGHLGNGFNITINGGVVTATGGDNAAGIGGGTGYYGYNITFNGGVVTATGGAATASAIGSGTNGSSTMHTIKADAAMVVKAGTSKSLSDADIVTHTSTTDIANSLKKKQYATVTDPLLAAKVAAIAEIDAAIKGVTNADIIAIATNAKPSINAATTVESVNSIKTQTIANITTAKNIYNTAYNTGYTTGYTAGETAGHAAGYAAAKDELPTEGKYGTCVTITKGEKSVTLYNIEKVEYSQKELSLYVEIGGVKWATCNFGATDPEESTQFYKLTDVYDGIDEYSNFTISVTPKIDLGAGWRLPTKAEAQALIAACDWVWSDGTSGTAKGWLGTSKADGTTTIFLPNVGNSQDPSRDAWFYLSDPIEDFGMEFYFLSADNTYNKPSMSVMLIMENIGYSIRPVYDPQE